MYSVLVIVAFVALLYYACMEAVKQHLKQAEEDNEDKDN